MRLRRAHATVKGLVQGVFFRYETSKTAKKYNVKGWVRNLPDGSVEAVFEGEEENIKKVIDFCRKGPVGAFVKEINILWETWRDEFDDFRIFH